MTGGSLQAEIERIRRRHLPRRRGRLRFWRELDVLDGRQVEAGVVLLPTRGCGWALRGGCSMCGYIYDAGGFGVDELSKLFEKAVKELGELEYLKLFTSGSFFDPAEVPERLMREVARQVNAMSLEQLQVESRPEFISEEALSLAGELFNPRLELGIGLESSSDIIRERCINKGFTFEDYRRAVSNALSSDVEVKTYLLLKPPFLLEREAVEDVVRSARAAAEAGSAKISINPVAVQRGTLVEALWKSGDYRPPWLWSLLEALKGIGSAKLGVSVISHPTAAGTARGAHNCGSCDARALEAVRSFSLTQSMRELEGVECECRNEWRDYLLLE